MLQIIFIIICALIHNFHLKKKKKKLLDCLYILGAWCLSCGSHVKSVSPIVFYHCLKPKLQCITWGKKKTKQQNKNKKTPPKFADSYPDTQKHPSSSVKTHQQAYFFTGSNFQRNRQILKYC